MGNPTLCTLHTKEVDTQWDKSIFMEFCSCVTPKGCRYTMELKQI